MDRLRRVTAFALATVLAIVGTLAVSPVPNAAASPGSFSGLVDIGGRSLYLECRGQGSPTVILESGARDRADVWSRDLEKPEGTRAMALPGVAAFTRVCAYDRPGTLTERNPSLDSHGPLFYPSRSDPVPQPRTTQDRVNDVHALLGAAGIPSPYLLVGHSAGGLVVRLYASEYPDEVVGMVLLDSTHEDVTLRIQEALAPDQWAEFQALTATKQDLLDAYPEAERFFTGPFRDDAIAGQVRQARKDAPLHPMPLVVLAHGIPLDDPFPGWPSDKMEGIMFALQQDLAQLVPNARLIIATESGHNIHQDQPEVVIDAIEQVVAAVRGPRAWDVPAAPPGGQPPSHRSPRRGARRRSLRTRLFRR
jgi:pimeloyl-ACP methyl ester carboxylesterase